MRRQALIVLAAIVLGATAFAAAGCGSKSKSSSGTSSAAAADMTATETDTMTTTETTDATTSQTTTTALAPELALLMSKNCRQLLNLSQAFAMAMTGAQSDIGETAKLMDKFAAETPEDVRDDFKVLAAAYVKIAHALNGLDLTSGKAPSAEMIAKLSQISTEIDSAKVSEASQHISTWAQKNCSGG